MTLTRWQLKSTKLDERERDFSADFTATNLDTGHTVTITLTQPKGDPASVLIGGCRALANLLEKVQREELDTKTSSDVGLLH